MRGPSPPPGGGPDGENAIDLADCVRSRCCRRSCAVALGVVLLNAVAPVLVARLAWAVLPDFRWEPLKGLVYMATMDVELGVEIQVGSDWAFVCVKAHCPAQSFACLFDRDCRRLVRELTVTESCSRELARARVCGEQCSAAASAFMSCLDGDGAPCVYARQGEPAVVRRRALDEQSLASLEALAAEQDRTFGHKHRTFGAVDGTKGHDVTWLTPGIYEQPTLLTDLKAIAVRAAAEGGWDVRRPATLRLRCAERLQYAGGNASEGLGWHWDVGSTLTTVIMLHTANASDGQLQVARDCAAGEPSRAAGAEDGRCCERSVRLERGDVAVYLSRHRHRVTTVHAPRTVVVLEWWRGEQTARPTRPQGASHRLQEPQTEALQLWAGLRRRRDAQPEREWPFERLLASWSDLGPSSTAQGGGGAAAAEPPPEAAAAPPEAVPEAPRAQAVSRGGERGAVEEVLEQVLERVEL